MWAQALAGLINSYPFILLNRLPSMWQPSLLPSGSFVSLSSFDEWPYWMLLGKPGSLWAERPVCFFPCCFFCLLGFCCCQFVYLLLLSLIDLWGMAFLFKSCGDSSLLQQILYLLVQLFRIVLTALCGTNLVCSLLADPGSSVKLYIKSRTFKFCETEAVWIPWTIDTLCDYRTLSGCFTLFNQYFNSLNNLPWVN